MSLLLSTTVFAQHNLKNSLSKSGNIGIGTTTPKHKLEVKGNSYFDGNITTNGLINGDSANISGNFKVNGTATYKDTVQFNYLKNDTIQGQRLLTIDPKGNVTYGVIFDPPGGGYEECGPHVMPFFVSDEINRYVSLCHYTKIGIGTLNPTARLDVHTTFDYGIISSVINSQKIAFAAKRYNEDVFRVYGDGHVYATEITVTEVPNFPDYVFNKNYNLMSLGQLGKYINKNNHLPDIPMADKVKAEDVNLGEMQKKLLKKVEELTLYTIQQQKEIDTLKAELENK